MHGSQDALVIMCGTASINDSLSAGSIPFRIVRRKVSNKYGYILKIHQISTWVGRIGIISMCLILYTYSCGKFSFAYSVAILYSTNYFI